MHGLEQGDLASTVRRATCAVILGALLGLSAPIFALAQPNAAPTPPPRLVAPPAPIAPPPLPRAAEAEDADTPPDTGAPPPLPRDAGADAVSPVAPANPGFALDLDTGGHRAAIRDLAFTPDGATLLSVSDDKTLRVWDWQIGATTATLRGQIGPGNEGLINALALSADGQAVAVGGYFGPHLASAPPFGDVRVFDLRSGKLTRVLRGHDYVVEALAYDPTRDELAVSGQGGVVQRWRGAFGATPEMRAPLDTGAGRVADVAYAAAGTRLIATSYDYGFRLFDPATGAQIDVAGAEGWEDVPIVALAVSGDGARFALAGADGRAEVRAALDGALIAALPVQPYRPGALAFTAAGHLVVSCGYACGTAHRTAIFDPATGAVVATHGAHDGPVSAVVVTPDGARIATAGGRGNEIRILDAATGAEVRVLTGSGRPMSGAGITADGTGIGWGSADPCPEATICPRTLAPLTTWLDLPTRARSFEPPRDGDIPARLRRALDSGGDLTVREATAPGSVFEASLLALGTGVTILKDATTGYYHSAFTLLGEGAGVITGGGNGILLEHRASDGRIVGEFTGHTGDILALAAAPAANRLLSASADQTLRLWNLETRQVIVSIFSDGVDWIIWTPQGYYHSSPGGDRLIGWHVNQGPDREARFIKARQLRQHLHSPEIVRRAIITGDPAEAVLELRGTDRELETLLSRRPPEFQMRLAPEVRAPDGFAALEIAGAELEELEAWGYSVLVNDRRVPPLRLPDPTGAARLLYQVPVVDGENDILVTGANDFGYVTERAARALFRAPPVEERGKLFVAVIGINDYPLLPDACQGRSCNLAFPVADAVEFLSVMAERTAPLYSGMETLVMVSRDALDAQPARRDALSRIVDLDDVLEPEAATITGEMLDFLARPGPDDTTIVFVAGHGLNVGERFFLIPANGQQRAGDWRMSSLVNWQVIQDEIGLATGRRILILDTCHAANAFNARLEKEAADARVVVFSATAANNVAQERKDLGHGIFTYALLAGLRGGADSGGDGVRLLGLADYVYREVIRLSEKRQEPVYHISQTSNFLLARP